VKEEPLYTDGENANEYKHCGKSIDIPQNIKNRTAI
jgi:hypothetical protein